MACCFCGSDSHDRENCPWNGTGKRMMLAVVLVLAVGCTAQKEQAIAPVSLDPWVEHVHAVMVACSKAVADAADAVWAAGGDVTQQEMQRAYEKCLTDMQVAI